MVSIFYDTNDTFEPNQYYAIGEEQIDSEIAKLESQGFMVLVNRDKLN